MDTQTLPPIGRGMVLEDVDWKTYTGFLKTFERRPNFRLTYDRGVLEIMPRLDHDGDSRFLCKFVGVLTDELGLTVKSGGSATLRRQLLQRGIEADECFWIANEPRMRGRRELNLRRDPPPDLAIEVDVTHSSLDRLEIYAALGVPEIWRIDGNVVAFLALQADGTYADVAASLSFPLVTPGDVLEHLLMLDRMDENAVLRRLRQWVRKRATSKRKRKSQ